MRGFQAFYAALLTAQTLYLSSRSLPADIADLTLPDEIL
jgi:hypothetical protein